MDVHDSLGTNGPERDRTGSDPPAREPDTGSAEGRGGYGGHDADPGRDSSAGQDEITASGDTGEAAGTGTGTGTGTMTVEVDGRTRELPAKHDYTGDGRPDAVIETPDGTVIVFADNEDNVTGDPRPDGRADEAYIVDKSTGQVVGAAHVDLRTGEWQEGLAPDRTPTTDLAVDAGAAASDRTGTDSGTAGASS